MIETQDKNPEFPLKLEKVGITNLKTLIKIEREGREFRHIPTITIFMDLDKLRKGVHMSRLIESITEMLEEEVIDKHHSLEQIGKHILEKLKKKHNFERAGIEFESELPVYEKTPASKKDTVEIHEIYVQLLNDGETWTKKLKVSVLGNTVCPHALSMNEGKTHIQRAVGILVIETDFDNEIARAEIRCLDECKNFSKKDIAKGQCPHTKYRRKELKTLEYTHHKFATGKHYHYSCVLESVPPPKRKKIIAAKDSIALKTHYPYYSGIEGI